MNEHDTTPTDNEAINQRALSQSDLDSMYLEAQDLLDAGTPAEDVRSVISGMLESAGQAPLAENETQRSITLDIDGEMVERTIVVSPEDFGTSVRPMSELISDGFVEADDSSETEVPAAKVEHDLGDTALNEVSRQKTIEERLGELDAMKSTKAAPESDEEEPESVESQKERAQYLFDVFGDLTDEFHQVLVVLERSQQPNEIRYHMNLLRPVIQQVVDSYPSYITDKDVRYDLDMVNSIMSDVQYRYGRLNQIIDEQGAPSEEFGSSVRSILHHGLMGAMYEAKRKVSGE